MTEELLSRLRQITPEEERILSGRNEIDTKIYMDDNSNVVDAGKMLESGKLIQVRPHTRFVHFPKHCHNYVELIYMCQGSTKHVINGEKVILNEGELLLLSQKAVQEVYPAGEEDIAVNFIILPEFFNYSLRMMESEKTALREFVVNALISGEDNNSGYLHFKVPEILPIQNLVENLIWTIVNKQPNKRSINQATMGLLFLQLLNYMDRIETDSGSEQQKLIIAVLGYIEEHYTDGELSELAKELGYDIYWLSKEIKKQTGYTYTDLVQSKRINQAAYLLKTTRMSVMDIGLAVGYENMSYFHKLFQKQFGMTPRKYRVKECEEK